MINLTHNKADDVHKREKKKHKHTTKESLNFFKPFFPLSPQSQIAKPVARVFAHQQPQDQQPATCCFNLLESANFLFTMHQHSSC